MVLGLVAAILVGLVLLATARLWSEIPAPRPMPPPAPPPPRLPPPPPRTGAPAREPRGDDERYEADEEDMEDRAWPAAGETTDRILVDHPLIRRAAVKAIEQGSAAVRYFVVEDDDLYFLPGALPDPAERERAAAILLQIQVGAAAGPADLAEVLWFVQRITRD